MAEWSNNNLACNTLWTTLFIMHQLDTNFKTSGDLTMSDLTYYNPLSSAEQRKVEANMLADQLDNVFRKARGAKYEDGITRTKAVAAMLEVLEDGEKQVKDLAKTADEAYLFWHENHS